MSISSFVLTPSRAVSMLDMYVLSLANSVCWLALSRSDRHILAFICFSALCRPDCAVLCCAVLAVDARRQRAVTYKKRSIKTNHYRIFLALISGVSAISEAQESEPSIMGQKMILNFALSS